MYFSFLLRPVRFFVGFSFSLQFRRFKFSLVLTQIHIFFLSFPDSSYGSSSVVLNARSTSVTENLLDDKELREDKFESEEVSQQVSTSPVDSKTFLSNVIAHASDKNCGDFESERESDSIYAPVETYQSQNYYQAGDYQAGDLSNWPCDLSRTSLTAKNRLEYIAPVHHQYQNSEANLNFRNLYNPYLGAMKGNLMTMCQFNDILSPPSSVSSSSGFEFSDNNNNSFITNLDQTIHLNAFDDEVFREEFKTEHCFLVEDANAGNYTTLTNASATTAPLDLYHLHDYQRTYVHNHSTSSGGDSRSPDGYNNEDYEHNFTQLTNLTTSRSNGIYSASPNNGGDHNIMSYDSTHVLSPTR